MEFFKGLKKKLAVEPDRNFDQRMMSLIDREMESSSELTPKNSIFKVLSSFRVLIPASALAVIAVFWVMKNTGDTGLMHEPVLAQGSIELFQDYEILSTANDELLSANDEEWTVILEEAGS